jgi:type I restriction enzyme S subunit
MKSNWQTKKLEDIVKSDSGAWGPPDNSGTAVLRSTNFTNDGKLVWDDVAYRKIPRDKIIKLSLKKGDILLEKSGGGPSQPVGRVVFFDKEQENKVVFSNFISRLRPLGINNKYLFYYLLFLYKKGYTNRLQNQTTGIRNLILRKYLDSEIVVPSKVIQHKIVKRLDAIRKLQELNQQEIEKARILFKSVLDKEFSNRKAWKEVKLSEICDVRDGTHDSPKYYDKGVPLITSKNLKGDALDFSNINFISEEDHQQIIKRSHVENGDILFGMIGTIGNPVIVDTKREFSIKNVGLIKFPSKSLVNNCYLRYFLESSFLLNQIARLSRGGTQKFVSLGNLRSLQICLPSISEQKKIALRLNEIKTYQNSLNTKLLKILELFESTLNKAMKGELVN